MDDENKNIHDEDEGLSVGEEIVDDLSLDDDEPEDREEETDNSGEEDSSGAVISKSKVVLVKKLLKNIQQNSEQLNELLSSFLTAEEEERISIGQIGDENLAGAVDKEEGGRIIEGVFSGEGMVGPDGKQYSVPANYASKSKLVEGDILKLTITDNGTFIYKQISPIERNRVTGKLEKGDDGSYTVAADEKRWHVLTASVTYYKGESGDEVIILVPKAGDSKWAAVDNIIRMVV